MLFKYGFLHNVATPYHSKIGENVEVSNRTVQSRMLDDAIWFYRIEYKTPIVMYP